MENNKLKLQTVKSKKEYLLELLQKLEDPKTNQKLKDQIKHLIINSENKLNNDENFDFNELEKLIYKKFFKCIGEEDLEDEFFNEEEDSILGMIPKEYNIVDQDLELLSNEEEYVKIINNNMYFFLKEEDIQPHEEYEHLDYTPYTIYFIQKDKEIIKLRGFFIYNNFYSSIKYKNSHTDFENLIKKYCKQINIRDYPKYCNTLSFDKYLIYKFNRNL